MQISCGVFWSLVEGLPRFFYTALGFYKNLFIYKTVLNLKYCKVNNIPNGDILLTTFCVLIEIKVR